MSKEAKRGVCRICGCTDEEACVTKQSTEHGIAYVTRSWQDRTKTLCTNPECLAKARKGD